MDVGHNFVQIIQEITIRQMKHVMVLLLVVLLMELDVRIQTNVDNLKEI
jgi:hypothetical protein